MNLEETIASLKLRDTYRRELVHAANIFPAGCTIQQIVDYAVQLHAIQMSLDNDEPYAVTVSRYATVTEILEPQEDEDATGSGDSSEHP